MVKGKRSLDTSGLYIPSQRYKWLEYEESGAEDEPTIRIKVRSSLTVSEFESIALEADTPMVEAYDLYAPYVVEWNVAEIDDNGDVQAVPAPAEGGGEMFRHIPQPLFVRIAQDMRRLVVRPVDPKLLTLLAPTDEQSPGDGTRTA